MNTQLIGFVGSVAVLGLAVAATPANAAIVNFSGDAALGNIDGVDLTADGISSPLILGFDESQDIFISSSIAVDYLISTDTINQQLNGVNLPSAAAPQLASGTYSSHLLHFAPEVGDSYVSSVNEATFTFDGDIVAIIANNTFLAETDGVFGSATATYAVGDGSRRSEAQDAFTLVSGNTLRIDRLAVGGRKIDDLRVITASPAQSVSAQSVPEPGMVLGATIVMGMAGLIRRLKA